uniref:Uncharacterized protein n=1 Tax=viral metagenome TaxID=1070528 RepID=A0A6M3L138_9ZZZZ
MTPLTLPGESPEAALRRLERRPDFTRLMETDAGQSLLREAARRAQMARRETVRA